METFQNLNDKYANTPWYSGYPEKRGLYYARIDEGPMIILHHHHCNNNGKSWWTDTAGYDAIGKIEYKLPPIINAK